jgi:hypothetical protein
VDGVLKRVGRCESRATCIDGDAGFMVSLSRISYFTHVRVFCLTCKRCPVSVMSVCHRSNGERVLIGPKKFRVGIHEAVLE